MTKHPVQITSPVRNTFRTDTPFIPVITIMETRAAFSPDERYAIHPRSSKITAVRSSLISHSVVSIFRPQNADAINRKIRNMPCPSYKPTPLANKSVPKNRHFCDAFPIEISGLNVSRSTSVARDGCRNLQQRELFGSYTRFPFHPGAARLRRAVGTLGEAKIRRIFQKAAFYGKIAATSRKDRRRRVADRAVGTGFRHSARCQPVVPWCSGQPPS